NKERAAPTASARRTHPAGPTPTFARPDPDRGLPMNPVRTAPPPRPTPSGDLTTVYPPSPRSEQRHRCNVALVGGSGPQFTSEIEQLLRRRLRVTVLVTLSAFVFFLVYSLLLKPEQPFQPNPFGLWLHTAVTVLQAALTVLLWGRWPLSLRGLRAVELTVF